MSPKTLRRSRRQSKRSLLQRSLCVLLSYGLALAGCGPTSIGPRPGMRDYQLPAYQAVPGGVVDLMGGNLVVRQPGLAIDTRLGTREVAAVYNSATGAWSWNLDMSYDGAVFVDDSGAKLQVSGVADGGGIPGTIWERIDGHRLRTKGGWLLEFDAQGRLASERWDGQDYPRLVHVSQPVAGAPRTVELRQCVAAGQCSSVFVLGRDAEGRLISIDDRAGRRAEFTWNSLGQLAQARDGLAVEEGWPGVRFEYAGDLLTARTTAEGERTEYAWFADGRLQQVRQAGGHQPSWSFVHNGKTDGLFSSEVTDPAGATRVLHFDAQRRPVRLEQLDTGEVESWSWAGQRPSSHTDASGAATRWSWLDDLPVGETTPSGNLVTTTWARGATNRAAPNQPPLLLRVDGLGLVEERSYDDQGRLVGVTNGAGETATRSYDALGHVASETTPAGVTRSFEGHGEHGHPTLVTLDGNGSPLAYDLVGNLVQGSRAGAEDGGVRRREYDAGRNLRRLTLVGSDLFESSIRVEVRSDGQRTAISRPDGEDHVMIFDALGRMVERQEKTDGVWRATRFEYDQAGRRTAIERPNGMRTEWRYDASGRLAGVSVLRHGVEESALTLGWSAGQLVSGSDSTRGTTERFHYDPAGRLVRVEHGDGGETRRVFDLRGRKTQETLLDAGLPFQTLGWAYDGADREVAVTDGGETILERSWSQGRLSELRYGNGITRSFGYHPGTGALASSASIDAGNASLEVTSVESQPVYTGLQSVVTTATHGGVEATTTETYLLGLGDVDPYGWRILMSIGESGSQSYSYDSKSNLSAVVGPSGSGTPVYNAEGNRLLSMPTPDGGTLDYAWDEAGFATRRGNKDLTWGAQGRLVSYGADSYRWDTMGRPISATVAGTTRTWRFGGAVVCDDSGTPLAFDLGDVRLDLAAGTRLYRHYDFRGNVKFTTDDAGMVRSHYGYSAYRLEAVYGADDDATRFVGRTELADGELMLLGARIYDPEAARFLSPDPIFQLVNQYAYTLGNPVWFSDPDGLHQSVAVQVLTGFGILFSGLAAISALLAQPIAPVFGILAAMMFAAAFGVALVGGAMAFSASAPGPATSGVASLGGGAGGVGSNGSGGGVGVCTAAVPSAPQGTGRLLLLQALLALLLLRRSRLRG